MTDPGWAGLKWPPLTPFHLPEMLNASHENHSSVKDANGNNVATAKVRADPANPLVLHLDLLVLASGPYQVQWNAVGNDGHRRTGAFKFSVK